MHLPGGTMIDRATDGIAALAVLSWFNPTLFSWLNDASQLAALIAPILGAIWLLIQISGWARKHLTAKPKSHEGSA